MCRRASILRLFFWKLLVAIYVFNRNSITLECKLPLLKEKTVYCMYDLLYLSSDVGLFYGTRHIGVDVHDGPGSIGGIEGIDLQL